MWHCNAPPHLGWRKKKVSNIVSGYSSLILEIRSVPILDPVPPPNEWHTWNSVQQTLQHIHNWKLQHFKKHNEGLNLKDIYLGGNHSSRPSSSWRQAWNQWAQPPLCNVPWPNCFQPHTSQNWICRARRPGHKGQSACYPWYQAQMISCQWEKIS